MTNDQIAMTNEVQVAILIGHWCLDIGHSKFSNCDEESMKAKLIHEEEMVNPVYQAAQASGGDTKGIQPILTLPEGHVMDNPDAWMLCALGKATPEDDECRERYDRYLGDPRRKAMLQNVLALRAAKGASQLDKKTLKWLEYMEAAYASELAAMDAA